MSKKIYVKNSGIHGKGLFARCYIKKDETIGIIEYKPAAEDGPYVLWVEEQGVLVEGDLKYINHSDKPNACYYEDLHVVAVKNIKKGEEITHNYGDDW
jgi:hypothetical protein